MTVKKQEKIVFHIERASVDVEGMNYGFVEKEGGHMYWFPDDDRGWQADELEMLATKMREIAK